MKGYRARARQLSDLPTGRSSSGQPPVDVSLTTSSPQGCVPPALLSCMKRLSVNQRTESRWGELC